MPVVWCSTRQERVAEDIALFSFLSFYTFESRLYVTVPGGLSCCGKIISPSGKTIPTVAVKQSGVFFFGEPDKRGFADQIVLQNESRTGANPVKVNMVLLAPRNNNLLVK